MFRSALLPLPILLALTACAPAAETGAGAETGDAASTVGSPDATEPGPDAYAPDPSEAGEPEPSQSEPGSGPTDTAGTPRGGPADPVIIAGPGLDESCKADRVQDVVGKMSDEALANDAMRRSGAKTVRVIPHDGMVTLEYRGDRLNLQLDEAGKIVAATCG